MDLAYDHIAEQSFTDRTATPRPGDTNTTPTPSDPTSSTTPDESRPTLQSELQETFRAFSSSPWASKLGGLWGNVRKQGESYYQDARKEAEAAGEEALKGFAELKETLVKRTRGLSLGEQQRDNSTAEGSDTTIGQQDLDKAGLPTTASEPKVTDTSIDETSEEELRENDTFIARFRSEAAKRIKDIERAEDAADEALLRLGTNIRNFLRDAVAVSPPEESQEPNNQSKVLFESKDHAGKRVIHTNRLDAQLHLIHTRSASFAQDPDTEGSSCTDFRSQFKIDDRTADIAQNLDKYPDLRRRMEELVPEKVDYESFWSRYYFLRQGLERAEEKRREMLKATQTDTEQPSWDEDSDTEEHHPSTPHVQPSRPVSAETPRSKIQHSASSSSDQHQHTHSLRPEDAGTGRRSHDEKSVADSDASYDLVSGATSRTPGSPKEDFARTVVGREEESDEDWE